MGQYQCKSKSHHSEKVIEEVIEHNTGDKYDLLVLGAGPAGVKAAVECANQGFRVGLLDQKGAITGAPTGAHSKALREAILGGARTWAEIESIIQQTVVRAEEATSNLLRTFHIELLKGKGSFVNHETLLFHDFMETDFTAQTRELKADCIVIATGSHANRLPDIPFHLSGIFDSDTISRIAYLPKKMVVQGAGIIGLEYALIFAKAGVQVVVVEFTDSFVPMLDKELRQALMDRLEEHDVDVRLQTSIKGVKSTAREPNSPKSSKQNTSSPVLLVETENSTGRDWIQCDCLLSATGRSGSSQGIGAENLEHMGMKIGRGKMIEVDQFQHTGVANVYAVGDVTGASFATLGQAQAMQAIQKHFGSQSVSTGNAVKPSVVWTIPEIAWAGITEQGALAQKIDFGTTRSEYGDTMRGMVTGDPGFLKFIFDRKDGKVLGVHICGDNACDLINYGAELVNNESTIYDILRFIFPAVSYHELYHLAANKCKMYLRGARSLSASTALNRIRVAVRKHAGKAGWGTNLQKTLSDDVFQKFDQGGTGRLSVDEIREALKMLGLNISSDVVKEMVDEVNLGQDGLVDYQKFTKALGS